LPIKKGKNSLDYYQDLIASIVNYSESLSLPQVSVIIVAYKSSKALKVCLESLQQQSFKNYEVIVIDNGINGEITDCLKIYNVIHITMKYNVGCSIGKNVGASYSRGDIVCFIDDDAVADKNFVLEHLNAYKLNPFAIAVRGRVLPKNSSNYSNSLASHYDLGESTIPAYIDTETNASFRLALFLECGGFSSPVIRGDTEGLHISFKIYQQTGRKNSLIYCPSAIVYHDYAANIPKLFHKSIAQSKSKAWIIRNHPEMLHFVNQFDIPYGQFHYPRTFTSRILIALLRRSVRFVRWFAFLCYSISK
jgi:glycosyltransferase involved in cell wall biosynthesis